MNNGKTLVCYVNFFSYVFIKYQLKILYEFNNNKNFDLIIFDNSNDSNEFNNLNKILKKYIKKYNNIFLFKGSNNQHRSSSQQHADALDVVYNIAKVKNYKYILIMDCDCFCLVKNYINLLTKTLEDTYSSIIGTPYNLERQDSIQFLPDFPVAFLMMIKIKDLDFRINFQPSIDKNEIEKKGNDVGYKLKNVKELQNYLSFRVETLDKKFFKKVPFLGMLPKNPDCYFFNNKMIAIHLRKSSRSSNEVTLKSNFFINYKNKLKWYILRLKISRFIYSIINKS